MVNVLFVCMGNICRSPTAEGVFVHFVKEAGLPVRSMFDVVDKASTEKKMELAARLRNHGVFLFHGGAVSIAHEEEHIDFLIAAYTRCAQEMAEGN